MNIEKVGWLDTHSEPSWADRVELLDEIKTMDLLCYTIGYVLAETGDRLILAATWSNNDMVGEVVIIPRRVIISRSVLVEEKKGEGI
jgi:hypothetical protein